MATSTNQETVTTKPPVRDLPQQEASRREALAGRLFQAGLQTLELNAVWLGKRLGYYATLEKAGPLTATELAKMTTTHPRYAREWLEQQAVAGILEVAKASSDPEARTFALPAGHAEVLGDEQSLFYLGFMADYGAAIPPLLPKVEQAFRTGLGFPWTDFGELGWQGQAAQNRPFFTHQFAQQYLAKIPQVADRLARPGARVADIACGAGWGSLGIARAYPGVLVDGFDLDREAIAAAKEQAEREGLEGRVSFYARDAADPGTKHRYDLVTIVEALHDMSRPVKVLRAAKNLLAPGGSVVVVDEKALESFTAPGPDSERFFYAASVTVCLPNGMTEAASAGTGTVMRPATVERYAKEAGFAKCEVLPLEHDFFRFYRLSG